MSFKRDRIYAEVKIYIINDRAAILFAEQMYEPNNITPITLKLPAKLIIEQKMYLIEEG